MPEVTIPHACWPRSWSGPEGTYTVTLRRGPLGMGSVGVRASAYVRCPECGAIVPLDQHSISREGLVSPEVVCGWPTCKWRVTLRLEGWAEHSFVALDAVERGE